MAEGPVPGWRVERTRFAKVSRLQTTGAGAMGHNGETVSEIGAAIKVRPSFQGNPGSRLTGTLAACTSNPWDTIVSTVIVTMMRKLPFSPRDLLVPTTTYTVPQDLCSMCSAHPHPQSRTFHNNSPGDVPTASFRLGQVISPIL